MKVKVPRYPLSALRTTLRVDENNNRLPFDEGITAHAEIRREDNYVIIDVWAWLNAPSALMEQEDIYIYILADSNAPRLVCRPWFERRFDVIDDTAKADCGFLAVIDPAQLPAGNFRIEIGLRSRLKPWKAVKVVRIDNLPA